MNRKIPELDKQKQNSDLLKDLKNQDHLRTGGTATHVDHDQPEQMTSLKK